MDHGFPTIGDVIGNDYEIVRPLGEGGMGAVYVARQRSTGRERALKLMRPELVADPRLRQRFEQEARIGSRVASDHVVEVIGAGVDEKRRIPWLAMELLQGESLAALVEQRGPRPPSEVRDIFEQLCHALAAAHREGIVHRDLKPENVFLAASRRVGSPYLVKVLDFGIAKLVAEAQTKATAAIGTPWWMAPEQSAPGAITTPAADVWALGLIAFYLLTARSYWRSALSDEPSPVMALREVVLEPLEPASRRAASIGHGGTLPPGFDAWFDRCLVREPSARFRDAGELFGALSPILSGAGIGPAVPQVSAAAPSASTPPPDTPARRYIGSGGIQSSERTVLAPATRTWSKSTSAIVLGLAAVALVAAVAGWMLMRGSATPAPAGLESAAASAASPATTAFARAPTSSMRPVPTSPRDEFDAWLAARNDASVSRSETVRGAGGVVAGLPPGWITEDHNDRLANEPFDCLVFHVATMSGGTVCFVTRDTAPEIAGKNGLDDLAARISWKDIRWSSWRDGTIGADHYRAKIIRGKGETVGAKGNPREGFAAFVEIPGRRPVLGIGSWRNEAQRRATLEIFRGLAAAPGTSAAKTTETCVRCPTQEAFDAALGKGSPCCPVHGCATDRDCNGRVCCRIPGGELCADASRCAASDRVSP